MSVIPKVVIKQIELCSRQELDALYDIFFESSAKKTFKDEADKKKFRYIYFDYYLKNHPEICLAAMKDGKVLGYIIGSLDSITDQELFDKLPHYCLFQDLFKQFPAHLHINTHISSRGLGVGGALISEFESKAKDLGSAGVHLITAPDARNVHFYQKYQYDFSEQREFLNNNLLLLGKILDT